MLHSTVGAGATQQVHHILCTGAVSEGRDLDAARPHRHLMYLSVAAVQLARSGIFIALRSCLGVDYHTLNAVPDTAGDKFLMANTQHLPRFKYLRTGTTLGLATQWAADSRLVIMREKL